MMPIAIGYGRKSFDDPENRTSSVNDQELFARSYAQQHSLEFLEFYGDNGITGATMQRPGLEAALAVLKSGKAQVLIIEDVDRLGRDQEHLSYMRKLFAAYDVTVHTVAAGPIDDLSFSFKGIIGEQQRMRIAYTTRRGLKGKAIRGGSTGGKTLGYVKQVLGFDAQGRQIDCLAVSPDEAALILQIFQLYADGCSLKAVCKILNDAGIPSPRARERGKYNAGIWNPSTLSGDVALGEGILNNKIYIGHRIFNRRRWVEIPNEHRGFTRQPRLNPESEWIIREEPDLRIIGQVLWDRVKARQLEARTARDKHYKLTDNPLAGAKRPALLLSGLVRCGVCGNDFVSAGPRWRCKSASRGSCTNSSITGDSLQLRALAGLRERLLTPEIIASFAVHLQRELDVQHRAGYAERDRMARSLTETQARIAKIVKSIESEVDAPRSLSARLKELEVQEEQLLVDLAAQPENTVVRLPANYEAVYRFAIAELELHLTTPDTATSRDAIRALIEAVVVHGGDSRGGKVRRLELHGDLFRMLDFAEAAVRGPQKRQRPQQVSAEAFCRTPLVAGVGFEPTTFRL